MVTVQHFGMAAMYRKIERLKEMGIRMFRLFNRNGKYEDKWDGCENDEFGWDDREYDGDVYDEEVCEDGFGVDEFYDDELCGDEVSEEEYYEAELCGDGESEEEYYEAELCGDGESEEEYYEAELCSDEESEEEYYEDELCGDEESEEEYYEDELCSDEESEEEYYEDELCGDGESEEEYYEAEICNDGICDDEVYDEIYEKMTEEEEVSSDEQFYEQEETFYGDEEFYAGDEGFYDEDEDIYYMDGREERKQRKVVRTGNFFVKLWSRFVDMSPLDKVVTATGAAVLVMAVVTAGVYVSAGIIDREIDELATVGSSLKDEETLGDAGLMAVADAKLAQIAAAQAAAEAEAEKEEVKDYNESEYSKDVTVVLDTVSVCKDLKIKFTNKDSGKLVSNVPFTVTITKPDAKSETWTDDDMDGIIYKKDIAPGTYKVSVNELSGDKYADYSIPSSPQSAEVKKEIAYKKVDVSNEIKKESEINVKKEDTAKKNTTVESSLQDTVTWVESTAVTSTYREVAKSTITDPMTVVKTENFLYMAGMYVSGGDFFPFPSENVQLDKTSATVYVDGTTVITATLGGTSKAEVRASSSDPDIADVSTDGVKVTVTGKAEGSAIITITHPDKDNIKAECTVTVKNNPKEDRTTKLKDNNGNQLYVNENDEYREAVYADYYTFSNFYVRGDTKYTGWQTLDGRVYFFKADGNKVTGEQVIQGARYNFASDGSLVTGSGTMGIDVSKWNGTIDWSAVKNSGVSYVIIRCGYRGSSQGSLIDDSTFATNIKGATSAGLKVGVYFFTQAVDEVEAVEEASMVLDRIKGYKISYPVFLDVEPSGGRADGISAETRTAVCKAFCETIQNAGYTAGVYANKTWLTEKINTSSLSAYKIWIAQYAASPTYTGRYDLWQYKSTGKVSGINGNVDMNISYLGY